MTKAPSPFSAHNPRLQTAVDATSLNAMSKCWRFYKYTILDGWRTSSVDLEYGILYGGALEQGDRARATGATLEEAQMVSFKWVLERSGEHEGDGTWRPWGGEWKEQWHCLHAPKSGKKCHYAHKGKWFLTDAPSICGECGSGIESEVRWLPYDKIKHRGSLVRSIVWYWEEQIAGGNPLTVYVFPNGTVGSELSFRIPLGIKNKYDEEYLLCGYLDGIVESGIERFILERKSTKSALGRFYFSTFSPNTQIDTYDLAASVIFKDLGIKGVMLEAGQVLVGGAHFSRQIIHRTEAQREEWLTDLTAILREAEERAESGEYPMNRSACYFCVFKGACSLDPARRDAFIAGEFSKGHWNPLEER